MKKRQRVLLAVTAVTSIAALTACGSGGGGNGGGAGGGEEVDFSAEPTGALTVWALSNADDDVVAGSRRDYATEALTDVDVQMDQTGFDAQKFTAATASGNVADVVQMDRPFVGTYAAKGLIIPLDECLAAHDVSKDYWYDAVIDDVTYDGSVYAIPQFFQPPAIITNTRLLEAAGLTNEDIDTSDRERLLAAVQKLYKESGGNVATLGLDPNLPGKAALWFMGNGGQIMDEEGRPTLDNEANVDALAFLKQLMDAQGGYADVKSFLDGIDVFGAENMYATDRAAAQIWDQWYPNVLRPYQADITINAVPFRDKDGNPFTGVATGSSFVIPKAAKNPAAACAWVINAVSEEAWMAAAAARQAEIEENPDSGGINTGLFTGSPGPDQAIREMYVKSVGNADFDQVVATYYEVVSEGKSTGVSAAGQEIQTELQNAVSAALLGEKTPEEALADGQEAALRAWEQTTGQ